MERKLVYNSVICLQCNETLVSTHVHDYKTCSCENGTMVDEGLQYERGGGKDLSLIMPNHLYTDSPHEQIRKVLKRNGITILKDISDEWLDKIIIYEEDERPDNPFLPIYRTEKEFRKMNDISIIIVNFD